MLFLFIVQLKIVFYINTVFDIIVGVDIGLEFYLPIMNKYSEFTYCPNQDTFESEGNAINETSGQEA